jgi:hypothetical protein
MKSFNKRLHRILLRLGKSNCAPIYSIRKEENPPSLEGGCALALVGSVAHTALKRSANATRPCTCTLNQGMEYLDPAILRPGRLRRYRYVGLLSRHEAEALAAKYNSPFVTNGK